MCQPNEMNFFGPTFPAPGPGGFFGPAGPMFPMMNPFMGFATEEQRAEFMRTCLKTRREQLQQTKKYFEQCCETLNQAIARVDEEVAKLGSGKQQKQKSS